MKGQVEIQFSLDYHCTPNLSIHQNSTQELTWNFLVTLDFMVILREFCLDFLFLTTSCSGFSKKKKRKLRPCWISNPDNPKRLTMGDNSSFSLLAKNFKKWSFEVRSLYHSGIFFHLNPWITVLHTLLGKWAQNKVIQGSSAD